jgi:hypothetical protein
MAVIQLSVSLDVRSEFVVSPLAMDFGSGTTHVTERTMVITSAPETRGRVLSVESTDPMVDVILSESMVNSIREFRVTGREKHTAPAGIHFGSLRVLTSSAIRPEFKLPVSGTVPSMESSFGM